VVLAASRPEVTLTLEMADFDLDRGTQYFESVPWTQRLIQDPNYTAVPTPSRKQKKSTEDAMFSETLNTKDAVRACLTLKKRPQTVDSLTTDVRLLLSLGYAVNGWPNLVHGGVIGLIIDEAMGTLLQLNANAGDKAIPKALVTASLKITYLRPIPTPSILMVTAKLGDINGRKIRVDAVIEDDEGNSMATGEALWVHTRESPAKL